MSTFSITRLGSGGIIANYRCTAACRHCLYGCSPQWSDEYISQETAQTVCRVLAGRGCTSVHIGGGEPFLQFDGLLCLVKEIIKTGLELGYIETNASWCTEPVAVKNKLLRLMDAGVTCVMASADPYHIEYVPLERPLRLIEQCQSVGMGYFVWKQGYLPRLSRLDPGKTHSRQQLEASLGQNYVLKTAQEYGIRSNGRALNIEQEYAKPRATEALLRESKPCNELLGTNHYHADLFGRFVPPGCTGIGIELNDLGAIAESKYPVVCTLLQDGLASLHRYACGHGFSAQSAYTSKCSFCFAMRKYLVNAAPTADLVPMEYYKQNF